MRYRQPRKQANPRGQPPAQIKISINISVHLRTDHRVIRIIIRVIRFPSRGQTKIPLVMQRQPRSQTRDTSPLKQIKRNRISQLPGFPKIIKPEPYPLINISIDTLVNTPRAITEQIFQVSGKSSPDNPPLGIRPLQKRTCRENILRTSLHPQTMHELTW